MKKRCQYIEKCCFFIRIIIIKNKCFLIFPDLRTYVLDIYDIFLLQNSLLLCIYHYHFEGLNLMVWYCLRFVFCYH